MTTKADVLAAREAYERVAEAYLREREWLRRDAAHYPWRSPPDKHGRQYNWTLNGAVEAATCWDEEPTA
jgi:hypothetical protein